VKLWQFFMGLAVGIIWGGVGLVIWHPIFFLLGPVGCALSLNVFFAGEIIRARKEPP